MSSMRTMPKKGNDESVKRDRFKRNGYPPLNRGFPRERMPVGIQMRPVDRNRDCLCCSTVTQKLLVALGFAFVGFAEVSCAD